MINAVFIHIPKTAGTTVRTVLGCSEYRDPREIPEGLPQLVSFGHMDYAELVERRYVHPKFTDSAFKFTFVRNPYDRAVSLYEYYLKIGKMDPCSFEYFIERVGEGVPSIGGFNQRGWSQCNPQVRWIENLTMDFIGSFEKLESHLWSVANILGVEIPEEIPRLQKTVDRPMDYYYNKKTRRIVEDFYREDFEEFGYDRLLK